MMVGNQEREWRLLLLFLPTEQAVDQKEQEAPGPEDLHPGKFGFPWDSMEEMEKLTPVLYSICEKTANKFKVCVLETDFFPFLHHSSKGRKAEESSLHHRRKSSIVAITKGSFVHSKDGH